MSDAPSQQGFQAADILAAFSLLTRLTVPVDHNISGVRAAAATWAYPLVGAAVGALAATMAAFAGFLGAPEVFSASLALATMVLVTGAMHEDGLADCADGLGGGKAKATRLMIMKDSRIGAYGAVALTIALIARWSGIQGLAVNEALFWPLVAVGAASRAPMVAAMFFMQPAKDDGLSANVGLPPPASLAASVGLALLICLLALGFGGISVLFWAFVGALPLLVLANNLVDGQTGDVLGGAQQCAEITALAAALAIVT